MIKIVKHCLLGCLSVIVGMLLITSCKKDTTNPAQSLPAITSVFPGSAPAKTPIVVKGINLKGITKVQFGNRVVTDFNATLNTDSSISVLVPDSMPLGPTFVQVYVGDGGGYAAYKFTVLLTPPVPKINSVTPGTALPGDVVTIAGTNFSLVRSVKFAGLKQLLHPPQIPIRK